MAELGTSILVVGGGLGGVAAALAACRAGADVVLTEETDWIGGQLTSQAVPPDEHPWIERFGATAGYRELRDGVRAYYRQWYPLRPAARALPALNPGAGRVSGLCHEPRVALAVLQALLAPHLARGALRLLLETVPVHVDTEGDRVRAVTVRDQRSGAETVISCDYLLDATENGDLLPLAGVEYVTGAEAQDEHGEPHAPAAAAPGNLQGFTVCFAVDHRPGEDHTIDRPDGYDFWRSYRPDFWPGPLLGLTAPEPSTLRPVARTLTPGAEPDPLAAGPDREPADRELWLFRRILAAGLFDQDARFTDVVLVNWPMNDYWLGPLVDVDFDTARRNLHEARELSRSLLYWMQTELPRPDGATGLPGLRIRPDVTGTPDGLAKSAYVRESRRIRAVTTVTENDVASAVVGDRGATQYRDSVGIGSYRIDLHPSTGGDNYIDVASAPFELPLGALLPVRLRNLLPAAKNIGTTHITNGCYRLHPVEWNVGEVAGRLAAHCVAARTEPRQVASDDRRLADFLALLDRSGVERHWPRIAGY